MSSSKSQSAAIERMLRPRSIAVAGVSQNPGSLGGRMLANLERFGFAGDIHLVHPTRKEINGRRCVPSTSDLPRGVDCVVLAIPTAGVLDAVRGCVAAGVGGVVIYSAGFAEVGAAGKARQEELARIAQAAGLVVAGPNCLGYVNFVDGITTTFGFTDPKPPAGPALGIVSQSGAMAGVLRAALAPRGIDVAYTVSTGNEAANSAEDFIEWMLADPGTSSVALIAEQIRFPRRFLELAQEARQRRKPIIVQHPGRSAAARQSAATHTGAMTRDWDVMRALVTHAGVALAETMEELVDLTELVVRCPSAPARGPVVFGESGAHKAMMLDLAEEIGLELAEPQGESRAVLAELAPGLILPTNPVDLTAQPLVDPDIYRRSLAPLLADDTYGSVMLAMILSNPRLALSKTQPVLDTLAALRPSKPVVFAMLGEDSEVPEQITSTLRGLNVPFFRSPDRALRAIGAFTRYGASLAAGERRALRTSSVPSGVRRLAAGTIPEHQAKHLLEAIGLKVPAGGLAKSAEEAAAIAATVGYPVALKAQSAQLSHKSDAGGVILNLGTPDELAQGWRRLEANIARAMPGLELEGVLVEAMARPGVELILGGRNDPEWGPVLMVGLGGVFAEALRDVRVLPPTLSEAEIAEEIRRLKAARVLAGFRGSPPADVEAVAAMAARLGDFMRDHPEVVEVDINPVVAYGRGEGAVALDALMVVI